MNSPSNNQPRPATVEQGALPALPDWCFRDDLGGLVPSEIRTALNEHARAAWNMGLDAGLLHAPAVTDIGLPELRDHLATAKVMGRSITLSPAAAGALHLAMTKPPPAPALRQSPRLADWAAYIDGPELQELKAEALALAADGANMSMDVGCMFVLAMIDRIESLTAAQQPAGPVVYPPDGTASPFTVINLGNGQVKIGDAVHDARLPALWFGKDGSGVGVEEELNRPAHPGETLAVITVLTVESIDTLIEVAQRVRRIAFPNAPGPQVAGYIEPQEIPCIGQCRTTLWATKQSPGAMAVFLAAPAAPAETDVCAEMRALCSSCGGTGDVTRIDGEWLGYCNCGSAK